MTYRVKNWKSFQSYKDRSPTWIRFHKSLLDDYEFQSLPLQARDLLPMLWLLASEHKDPLSGILPSEQKIAFRLRRDVSEITKPIKILLEQGFIEQLQENQESVTVPYNSCEENVTAEKENIEKTDTETERVSGAAQTPLPPITPKQEIYFGEKNQNLIPDRQVVPISVDFDPDDEWGKYAEKMGFVNGIGLRELEKFIAYWTAGKGSGARKTKRGWRQAWSNWLEIAAKRM